MSLGVSSVGWAKTDTRFEVRIEMLFCRELLKSRHIDVSYFAAGIIAHLVTANGSTWSLQSVSRREILHDLVSILI